MVPIGTRFPPGTVGSFKGATINASALHAIGVCAVTNGLGSILKVTVNAFPKQPAALTGTTVYEASKGDEAELINASSAKEPAARPVPTAAPPA